MAVRSSKLGSHGVRIVADCCLIDFLAGELPSTPDTLTRDLRKLSIPVIPNVRKNVFRCRSSGAQRYAPYEVNVAVRLFVPYTVPIRA